VVVTGGIPSGTSGARGRSSRIAPVLPEVLPLSPAADIVNVPEGQPREPPGTRVLHRALRVLCRLKPPASDVRPTSPSSGNGWTIQGVRANRDVSKRYG
jgi:hypothetical protein